MQIQYFSSALVFIAILSGCSNTEPPSTYDDSVLEDNTITERDPETTSHLEDDPSTTNDESNDQPVGQYGTVTLCVRNPRNGNRYTLDADVNGFEVTTIYFPKGGNIDFIGCELDSDLTGYCSGEMVRTEPGTINYDIFEYGCN